MLHALAYLSNASLIPNDHATHATPRWYKGSRAHGMKVLNVAEKPSMSRQLASILSSNSFDTVL